ncbi:MAG: class I SAM-dependent methyltransferase [Dehalococcoidia bacterium]|nr:class I SAM-dependent methyltransferase [Dehalococcoidia bacterium]
MDESRHMSNNSFRMMTLIHDNPLRRVLDKPVKTLRAAGIRPGQQVLEVGCGPGFFTIPAAKIVGDGGFLYAIDLQPLALKAVNRKLRKAGLDNVRVTIADAASTGLPAESIDLAFLFGVIHALPLETVVPEIHRVLKSGGVLAVQTFSGRSLEGVTEGGLFAFAGKEGKVARFQKN